MCEKIIQYLKTKRYAYLECMNCRPLISEHYNVLTIRVALLNEILEELKELKSKDQNDIIIA